MFKVIKKKKIKSGEGELANEEESNDINSVDKLKRIIKYHLPIIVIGIFYFNLFFGSDVSAILLPGNILKCIVINF